MFNIISQIETLTHDYRTQPLWKGMHYQSLITSASFKSRQISKLFKCFEQKKFKLLSHLLQKVLKWDASFNHN